MCTNLSSIIICTVQMYIQVGTVTQPWGSPTSAMGSPTSAMEVPYFNHRVSSQRGHPFPFYYLLFKEMSKRPEKSMQESAKRLQHCRANVDQTTLIYFLEIRFICHKFLLCKTTCCHFLLTLIGFWHAIFLFCNS